MSSGRAFFLALAAVQLLLLWLADRFVAPLVAPAWQMPIVLLTAGAVFLTGAGVFVILEALVRSRRWRG